MADQSVIDAVTVQLPDIAVSIGVDDSFVGSLLDSGLSQIKTLLTCWRVISGKTSTMTDVSESGSSRNMSVINTNARQQVTYYQMLSDREDNAAGTEQVIHGISTGITRV